MKTYVTFGQLHCHRVNGKTFDKDCVAVIERKDESDGRDFAFECFGDKFFTTYTDREFIEKKMVYFPRGYIQVEGKKTVKCEDCENEFDRGDMLPYKYEPSILICQGCHDERMSSDV